MAAGIGASGPQCGFASTISADDIIIVGEIELNKGSYEVSKNGEAIAVSTREFQLLQYLMENAGKVLTREQIFSIKDPNKRLKAIEENMDLFNQKG